MPDDGPTGGDAAIFGAADLGPVRLRNRVLKAATFEGMSPGGLVTDELVGFHRRVAAGGAGLTTLAYCAVAPEGRTHADQILLTEAAIPGLRRLTEAVHAEGAAAAAQIGHAGPVANAASNRVPSIAPMRMFNPLSLRFTRAATDDDLDRVVDAYRAGARVAVDAGFDALEVHLGHHYLLSAFLSPKLNRREDRWGGDAERRARFPRRVLDTVRAAVDDRVAVTAKLNMSDGVRGGIDADESIEFVLALERDGTVDAVQLTGGSSLLNPMYLFRGEAPRREFAATLPAHLRLGFRLVGKRFLPEYPFEEAYFLPQARRFRAATSLPLTLLGGINRLDTIRDARAEGFDFVAMARALLREPDLVERFRVGTADEARCIHCNRCMPTIYTRTRCVLDDP